jgi:hypothetical protein
MSDYDALTELFLSDGGPAVRAKTVNSLRLTGVAPSAATPPAAATESIVIEGLILGHLPVLGAAWVTQYAKHAADTIAAPVGLLRVQGGQVSVDVVTPRGGARINAQEAERESLADALAAACAIARHWLVRVDDTSEPDLLGMAHLSCVTLLTGADDAAVVASYRTMKGLCALPDAAREAPALHLAIMGAADDKAEAAEAKLRRAATTFLGRDIDATARVAKIGATAATAYYRGEAEAPLAEMIGLLRAPARVAAPALVESKPLTMDGPRAAPVPAREEPAPVPRVAPLSSDVLPDGLTALAVTCPFAPRVRLAIDTGRGLHLIAGDGDDSARELLVAASWAGEHADLLAAACPGLRAANVLAGPTLHVMTSDARAVRSLLDTAVRVHLVVDVGTARVVKALN